MAYKSGMTLHWICPKTRERKMAVLACERILGEQNGEALAKMMCKIFTRFGLTDRVKKVVTDNGSNFCASFRKFGDDTASAAYLAAKDVDWLEERMENLGQEMTQNLGLEDEFETEEDGEEDGAASAPKAARDDKSERTSREKTSKEKTSEDDANNVDDFTREVLGGLDSDEYLTIEETLHGLDGSIYKLPKHHRHIWENEI